jgi:hypothetical protein
MSFSIHYKDLFFNDKNMLKMPAHLSFRVKKIFLSCQRQSADHLTGF